VSSVASAVVFLSILALCLFGQVRVLQEEAIFVAWIREEHKIPICIVRIAPPDPPDRIHWPAAFRYARQK
jgi:hypothetical protein